MCEFSVFGYTIFCKKALIRAKETYRFPLSKDIDRAQQERAHKQSDQNHRFYSAASSHTWSCSSSPSVSKNRISLSKQEGAHLNALTGKHMGKQKVGEIWVNDNTSPT